MKKTLISILITAILLGACSSSLKTNTPISTNATFPDWPTQAPGAVNTQTAPSLSPDEVHQAVLAAWRKLESAGPRRFAEFRYEDGKPIGSIEADAVPPDYHQVITEFGKLWAEFYVVDGTVYSNDKGVWSHDSYGTAPNDIGSNLSQALDPGIFQSDGKTIGIEVINGSPAIIYRYSTIFNSPKVLHQYRLWVDQSSGLPVRLESRTMAGFLSVETIIYDDIITITLPTDAKNSPKK
jgi:hypothetical protein